jgi:hypothetical protein
MSSDSSTLFERVSSSFSKLSSAAKDLNNVSDELGRAISTIDLVLQRLNLGVPSWVVVVSGDDRFDCDYWSRDIGYAKISGRWGIALRARSGDNRFPEDEASEMWVFNDAPRWQRIEALEKIPDLLEQLIKDAETTTKTLKGKIDHAKQLAEAFEQAARPPKPSLSPESAIDRLERAYGRNKGKTPQQSPAVPAITKSQK